MGQNSCKPQPGDLIEIFRPGYQHWAVYVGDGYVIHVTDDGGQSGLGSSVSISAKRAKVKKQLLKEVVRSDKWRVNNKYDWLISPRPMEKIIRRAEEWIGSVEHYNLLVSNCEHFVTWVRYGVAISQQVLLSILGLGGAAALGVVGVVPAATCFATFVVGRAVYRGLSCI